MGHERFFLEHGAIHDERVWRVPSRRVSASTGGWWRAEEIAVLDIGRNTRCASQSFVGKDKQASAERGI